MLFNVKFNAGGHPLILEDNNVLYYSIIDKDATSKMKLDFSNISPKVERFTLLKEDTVCKESVVDSDEDMNNFEIEMDKLSKGIYKVKITTENNQQMMEEICV